MRWLTDRWRGVSASEAETETSPGVLLSSGYIAGGTLCGLILGFLVMLLPTYFDYLNLSQFFGKDYLESPLANMVAVVMFALLGVVLFSIGSRKDPQTNGENRATNDTQGGVSPGS